MWIPELIIVTCPRVPKDEYINHSTGAAYEDVAQIERRCSEIRKWNDDTQSWVYIKGMPTHE